MDELDRLRRRNAELEARDAEYSTLADALKESEAKYRRSEDQLQRLYEESHWNEALYRSLLNSSADAVVIYDMEGRTQFVNQAFENIFGWRLADVRGKRIPFVPESEISSTLAEIRKITESGEPVSGFQTKRSTRDGRILDISISASRFSDPEGKPAGVLGILRDISGQKRAEEALREGEEKLRELYAEAERRQQRYRTLLDVSPDPIVVYDMEGTPSYANPAFARVFGWGFDEFKGKRADFVPDENWPETHEMISAVLNGESFSDRETRRYTSDGRVIDVSVSGAAFLDQDNRPIGSVVHLRDITHRKLFEATLGTELRKFRALYDLALAMTAERSLDVNLALIVEKSRELLSADMAFMSLRDKKAGDLYMHASSGVLTDGLKNLRIPIGRGLGGKVAETGRAYVVEDYYNQIGPVFHDIARAEGLFSGIAVPVQMGGVNLGVLYAFNRTRRVFSEPDLDTISLLGNLSAVEITRKRSEERLRESEDSLKRLYEEAKRREELYVSLLNSSADAIIIYDMNGLAEYVNPSFTRIFGWTAQEILGKRIPFVPEDQFGPSMTVIRGVLENGAPCSAFETRRLTKNGDMVQISISASRYHDKDDKPAGMLAILRDVTDRKRAEKALRESEERFRTLAEVGPFGLVVMGGDGRTEYINPKFSELFGYTIEDLPDMRTWFLKAYPNERSRLKAESIWREDRADLKVEYGIGAEASPRIFKIRCRSDAEKIVSFRAVVLADGRIIGTFIDVTAEVEAQQEIIRAKNEWERTFNSVSDLIIILDGNRRIVRANRAAAERLGQCLEELVGKHASELSDSGAFPASLCPDVGVLADGKDYSAEVFDQGLRGVFDLRASPLRDEQGRLLGSVNVARDITAFKAMERARRSAVHHLSHELRTPLAVIKGSVKGLDDEDLSQAARRRRLDRIQRNLDRLADIQYIVEQIVAPREYRPTYIPIASYLSQLLTELRRKSSDRAVTLKTQPAQVETAVVDPVVFRDVVDALVKNAIENTPDQGEVLIALSTVTGGTLLQVVDYGVGIDQADLQFVFEAFHHTQETDRYATLKPFDFGAGGKGLELMQLKVLSEGGAFDISFDSRRCRHLLDPARECPGRIDACAWISGVDGCKASGGTTFSVLFSEHRAGGGGRA
jgi:two-component system phosphate regulon sensor histidine kinase PhoR